MNGLSMIQLLQQSLKQSPQNLDQLWLDHSMVWGEFGWSKAQLRLWLRCLPEIKIEEPNHENPLYRLSELSKNENHDLGSMVVAILEATGKPVPINQLITKMPKTQVLTEPMIIAAIKADPRLQQTGPLVRLL